VIVDLPNGIVVFCYYIICQLVFL